MCLPFSRAFKYPSHTGILAHLPAQCGCGVPKKRQNSDCGEIMDFSGRVSVIGVVGEKHDIFKTREETQMNHVQLSLCRTQPKFIQRDGERGEKDTKIQPQQILSCSSWLKNLTGDVWGLCLTPVETLSRSVQSSFV